jgi:uncharacterized alpha-E superfamily protein
LSPFEEWNSKEKRWQLSRNHWSSISHADLDTEDIPAEKADRIIATRAQNKLINATLAISGVVTVAALKLTQNNR